MKTAGFLCFALVGVATVIDQVTAKKADTYDMGKLNEEEPSGHGEEQNEIQMDDDYINPNEPATKSAWNSTQEVASNPTPEVAPYPAAPISAWNSTPADAPNTAPIAAPISEPRSAPTPAPTPSPTPKCAHTLKKIDHDKIHPFPQPDPVTISERAAVRFKPMLRISNGCDPYPMVTAEGETSGGLKTTGPPDGNCKGDQWGSQVYACSTWFKGVWAIAYVWYFPKDSTSPELGHRHDFEQVIVWLDNPDNINPKILVVTPSSHDGFSKHRPPNPSTVSDTHVKVRYFSKWPLNHELESTSEEGGFQDLIMWHQLPEKARCALNTVYWGEANMPIRDENFWKKLEGAYPF